jgi:hypothetical protein
MLGEGKATALKWQRCLSWAEKHLQSNLFKREFFMRDFALSGTFFAASTFSSQISLVMRDSPKCKRDSPKFWPKAEFFLRLACIWTDLALGSAILG